MNNKGLTANRCCMSVPAKGGGASGNYDDVIIRCSVGRGGMNGSADVKIVQKALNYVPQNYGGPQIQLVIDGYCGPKTITAIEDFQTWHFGFKDGRIDVLGKTHAKLSSMQPAKQARMRMAHSYLKAALNAMQKAAFRVTMATGEWATGGGLLGTPNLDLLDAHFDIRKSSDPEASLRLIGSVYALMLGSFARTGGLTGWMVFEAEPFANPYYAFTYWGGLYTPGKYIGWQRLDTIYLSTVYDRASDDDKVQTIIHELAHFVGPVSGDQVTDYAYGRRDAVKMLRLSPYQKQHNAESYGNFALSPAFG